MEQKEKNTATGSLESKETKRKARPKGAFRPRKVKQPAVAPAAAPVNEKKTAPVKEKKPAPKAKRSSSRKKQPPLITSKLHIASLGGLHEIGKNMTMIEYEDDIILIDCGIAFPDEDMLGVDLVTPDITYLEKNRDRVRAILLTHGHEDHIGSLPYVLRTINPDIYGTKLTLGIVERKLSEHKLPENPKLHAVQAGDVVKVGKLTAE